MVCILFITTHTKAEREGEEAGKYFGRPYAPMGKLNPAEMNWFMPEIYITIFGVPNKQRNLSVTNIYSR